MDHHVVYWKMARREVDVSDAELASLRAQERLHEVYIEFLDGRRLRHDWDPRSGRWSPAADAAPQAA